MAKNKTRVKREKEAEALAVDATDEDLLDFVDATKLVYVRAIYQAEIDSRARKFADLAKAGPSASFAPAPGADLPEDAEGLAQIIADCGVQRRTTNDPWKREAAIKRQQRAQRALDILIAAAAKEKAEADADAKG